MQNANHTFATSGNYNVSLQLMDFYGCQQTYSTNVPVLMSPTADYITSNNLYQYILNTTISFVDLSVGASKYYWDFGNGDIDSSGGSPQYTYETGGIYDVELTIIASNDCPHNIIYSLCICRSDIHCTRFAYRIRFVIFGYRAHGGADRALPFGLDELDGSRLVTWAAKESDLEARVAASKRAGYDPGIVLDLFRDTPQGERIEWRLTMSQTPGGDGLVPFLIDWGGTAHPATSSAKGCRLVAVRAEHPDPEPVRALLAAIGSDLEVTQAPRPALITTLDTPRGRVELR